MLVNDRLLSGHELRPRVEITAREVLRVCAARANEAIIVLVDEDTVFLAFTDGLRAGEDYELDTYRLDRPLG